METKSNALSSSKLNKLLQGTDHDEDGFQTQVFVYAKYIVLKQMARENKHDIAIEYCRKVIFEHKRNWNV